MAGRVALSGTKSSRLHLCLLVAIIVVDEFVYPSLLLLLGMLDFKLILQLCCSVPCACMLDLGLVIS